MRILLLLFCFMCYSCFGADNLALALRFYKGNPYLNNPEKSLFRQIDIAEKKYANLDGYLIIYKEPSIVSDKLATLISDIFTIHPQLKINLVESYFSHTLSALEKSQASIGIVHAFEEQLKEIPDELEFIPVLHRVPVVYTASTSNFYKQHNSTSLNALFSTRKRLSKSLVFKSWNT